MAAVDDFVADPVAFMTNNIVEVTAPDPSSLPQNGTVRLSLHQRAIMLMNKPGGGYFDLFVTQDPNKTALDAYFCPYANDKSYFITLGNAANYMFTPKMDGCAFGIGTQANGACRVGHVNLTNLQTDWKDSGLDVATDRMYQAQRNLLMNRLGVGMDRIVDPSDYRGPTRTDAATTFGVRNNQGVWSFRTLRFAKPGLRTALHLGIHDHVNT